MISDSHSVETFFNNNSDSSLQLDFGDCQCAANATEYQI